MSIDEVPARTEAVQEVEPTGAAAYAAVVEVEDVPEDLESDAPEISPAELEQQLKEHPINRPRSPLGHFMREHRIKAKLSQNALAKRTGLTQGHVSGMECGYIHPKIKTSNKVADAIGVPRNLMWQVACDSKSSRSGNLNNEGHSLVPITGYVPKELAAHFRKQAEDRGVTTSRVVSESLRAIYSATRRAA